MKEQKSNADKYGATGPRKPTEPPTHEVDLHQAAAKHAEPLGRLEIAPAKPLWPVKK